MQKEWVEFRDADDLHRIVAETILMMIGKLVTAKSSPDVKLASNESTIVGGPTVKSMMAGV